MRDAIRETAGALKAEGDHDTAQGFTAAVRLARRLVVHHGFSPPENLTPVDEIGDRHFERKAARKAFKTILRAVPDQQLRIRLEDALTAIEIAECYTYFWYGLATALVMVEPIAPKRARTRRRKPRRT
jgi:hypothetical protein